jgi:hypothetical protein
MKASASAESDHTEADWAISISMNSPFLLAQRIICHMSNSHKSTLNYRSANAQVESVQHSIPLCINPSQMRFLLSRR